MLNPRPSEKSSDLAWLRSQKSTDVVDKHATAITRRDNRFATHLLFFFFFFFLLCAAAASCNSQSRASLCRCRCRLSLIVHHRDNDAVTLAAPPSYVIIRRWRILITSKKTHVPSIHQTIKNVVSHGIRLRRGSYLILSRQVYILRLMLSKLNDDAVSTMKSHSWRGY